MRPILVSVLVLIAWPGLAADGVGLDAGESYCSPLNYAGCATLTLTNCPAVSLTSVPVYLTLSESRIPGFRYADVKNGTGDIVFFTSTGRVLDYELEGGWNTAGDTHLWIKPSAFRNGETITMCWNLRDGYTAPKAVTPENIWNDYVGVWHMDETITSAEAPTTLSKDSTGHGLDAKPNCKAHNGVPQGNLSQMVSTPGHFGNARVNATECKQWGNHLEVPSYDAYGLGSTFTISAWVQMGDLSRYTQLFGRKALTKTGKGWHVESQQTDTRQILTLRGSNTKNADIKAFDSSPKGTGKFYYLALCYDGNTVSVYCNGLFKGSGTIDAAADNGEPLLMGCGHLGEWMTGDDFKCWNGAFDEVRLSKGARSAELIALDYNLATNKNLWVYGAATNDVEAVLKNSWTRKPSVSKITWDADDPTDRPTLADFDLGAPGHGTPTITFYNKTTGETLGSVVPKAPGEYRATITVEPSRDGGVKWGGLEETVDFRIVSNQGKRGFERNADRILLMNDDGTDDDRVQYQAYGDEEDWTGLFWRHLDENGKDASTTPWDVEDYWSVSPFFNFGGGTHHQYLCVEGAVTNRLWDLRGVRFGNTFNNGEEIERKGLKPEEGNEGLAADQNYLPWNPDSFPSPVNEDVEVGPFHRYASHAVMQNVTDAAIASSMYTNGIGTIYFDAVNGWTDNVRDASGKANYELVVEVATGTARSALEPPTDAAIASQTDYLNAVDPFVFAAWERCPVRVLRVSGTTCTDLGTSDSVVLDIEDGGAYTNFYRVFAPVNVRGNARFRIRRVAIDEGRAYTPDGNAHILVDNVICSVAPDHVNLEPYGRYDADKTGHEVQGWGGAFIPAFPAPDDVVTGRAKATMASGAPVEAGTITSATMHYRWHYIDQQTTGELLADLDPVTLQTRKPLALPPYEGDIAFWFDVNQVGSYYAYVDYSGQGIGLKGSGYTEAVTSVTNRAPDYLASGDWFVRVREGASHYSELVLRVKTAENAVPQDIPLWVTGKNMWRGYYRTKEALADGIWWRIEARDAQEDGATEWQRGTNAWYVADWTEKPPSFPASGRMADGTDESWSRMVCDAQTGYLMFQIDETTRGVTVMHADYQTFNDWNSPDEYFSGSSSEPNEKQGTSSEIQTFVEDYGKSPWEDEASTRSAWQLVFRDERIGPSYPEKTTFASIEDVFGAWNLGKGQWAYGRYKEPTSSIVYQAAGSSEGRAEFAKTDGLEEWPRGIGSVSFKARLAQSISPMEASFVSDGTRLTNYTFMARGAFDRNQNKSFAGNAALSLFAYYREKVGTYEARWEQINGDMTTNPGYAPTCLGPKNPGQRLVISRWDAVGSTYKETELIAVTNVANGVWSAKMPTMPYGGSSETNNLMPLCVSVTQRLTEAGTPETVIVAGVRITASEGGGVTWKQALGNMGDSWYFAVAVDGSAKRLTSGSYGVLTSNSEGMLLTPQIRRNFTGPEGTALSSLAQGHYEGKLSSLVGFDACWADIAEGWWPVNDGRQKVLCGSDAASAPYGFAYVAEPQTIDIFTMPLTGGSWTRCAQVPVTNFGEPKNQADCQADLRILEDCKVRFQTGGGLDDFRRDVALSDIVLTAWRGRDNWSTSAVDWDFKTDKAKEEQERVLDNDFGRTNIVFTSGWITNGAVRLSALRTPADTASSVRSPLFDGLWQYREDGTRFARGVGLGMMGIRYREPSQDIVLKLQVATNYTAATGLSLKEMSRARADASGWTTIATLRYADLMESWDAAKKEGSWQKSFGWHGAKGMMRFVIDGTGEIDIIEAKCMDEPALDKGCWWGWNLKPVGDAHDSVKRMYLADYSPYLRFTGQSMALNNSTSEGTNPSEEPSQFVQHLPFVQSPSFTNALIGQISFKARKYDISERSPAAKVAVYGAPTKPDELIYDKDWKLLGTFDVTNTVYETFTCKTKNAQYLALRLVVLMDGTVEPPEEAEGVKNPQRVLLDEITVSEAVSPMMTFRRVGAFREGLKTTDFVPDVPSRAQQPLCHENWGIQAEVFATMLADEIYTERAPNVTLHWFEGKSPWGYENWKDRETGRAALAPATGTNLIYRSSYELAVDAVMPAQEKAGTVVQYMLEVEYWTVHSEVDPRTGQKVQVIEAATNWLDAVAWQAPEWYAPVDYNADARYGAGKTFAGFTILDAVAPGWAWINEVNLLGEAKGSTSNPEEQFQYVEVCAPVEADLSNWKLRFLEAASYSETVVTNYFATFGAGSTSGTKMRNVASNMVFHCLGNKESDRMKRADGTLDGLWHFQTPTSTFPKMGDYYCVRDTSLPIGVQLIRPTGIIEHSIVVVGTNKWGRVGKAKPGYDPNEVAEKFNRNVPGSRFFYAGEDCCGALRSVSVTDSQGESAEHWANDWYCTPGYINTNGTGKVQQIAAHPEPAGDTILLRARVDRSGGPIRQYVGGAGSAVSGDYELIILKKGGTGTNILYQVDPWYEIAGVTTNGMPRWTPEAGATRELELTFGAGASNNIEIVASSMVDRELQRLGLTDDNRYKKAVMAWLTGGKTLKRDFAHNGTIALADFVGMDDKVVTNLSLTTMYWLDMDPTLDGQILKGGMLGVEPHVPAAYEPGDPLAPTNLRVTVYLKITNRVDGAIAPYTLRGLEPGSVSTNYDPNTSATWTSETFKVTGILGNGRTDRRNKKQWIPLRWFVFKGDSFYQPGNEAGKEPFTADIEIVDPLSVASPGAEVGWHDWAQEHGWTPVFPFWYIDERNKPTVPEVLKPENFYD